MCTFICAVGIRLLVDFDSENSDRRADVVGRGMVRIIAERLAGRRRYSKNMIGLRTDLLIR